MSGMDEDALADLIKRNEALMGKLTSGTATRDDKKTLEVTMDVIEKRTAERASLDTMTREELIKKNELLMSKVKVGTATRADAERLKYTMEAIVTEDKECTAIKRESASLDTAALMKRNAELMAAVGKGTASRSDKTKLEATMAAIEKAKADADAVRTSMSMTELVKRNEALMAKMKAGTATRADVERAKLSTKEMERRSSTTADIAKETEMREIMKRNAALMKTLKEGTATRADREALEAVMRRKEALDKELSDTAARETAAKLTKARAELRITERKTAVRDVMRMVKQSEKTDLCFMIDATRSMSSHIEGVKTQITKIATDVQRTNPYLQLRVGITGYRDALEGDGGNSPFDFTDSLERFVSNVSSIEAKGGGDGCEDVASGYADVLRFSWSSPTRVLFFIADAPSHGARYHDGGNDNHPAGDHGIPEKLRQLKAMNIDVVFCSINNSTRKMIEVMNADLGGADFIKTVPLSDPSKLTAHATTTLRKSMHKTLTGSRARTKRATGGLGGLAEVHEKDEEELRAFSLTPAPPDWPTLPALPAQLRMNGKVTDIASLKSGGKLESLLVSAGIALESLFSWRSKSDAAEKCMIKVAPEPFATGNLRFARHGQIVAGGASDLGTFSRSSSRTVWSPFKGGYASEATVWQPCVFKDFKSKDAKAHTLERYVEEMEVNSVASALAAEFNKTQHPPANRQMRYVLSSVATVETAKGPRTYFAEPFLDGTFTRFSYNTGYWEEDRLDPWLLRFALWTHEVTGGFMMVADLQGIVTDEGYVLTDPVILCSDLSRFGNTNLGAEMMERCKSSAEKHLADVGGSSIAALDIS